MTSADLGLVYRFVLEEYVDQVDHTALIEAARRALRDSLVAANAPPVDTAPLDLLPLPSGNPQRDWRALALAFDSVVQRRPAWSVESRPDYQAIRRMVQALDDSHATFVEAEEVLRRGESGYSGIGVLMSQPDPVGSPVVIEVFRASPAEAAGVQVGDRITSVNGRPTAGVPLSETASSIRGQRGTEVRLEVERTQAGNPFSIRMTRQPVDVPVAEGQMLEDQIGYVRVRSFSETTPERVGALLFELRRASARAYILDLRGNPGGDLRAVAQVAGYFLPNTPIGISVGRDGESEAILPESRPFMVREPLIMLVNGESSSGAEVLAAALKEYGRALILGERTAGRVGIATAHQLSDGSQVQIPVRRILSPSGQQIDRAGVEPDETVPLSVRDLENGRDPQRERALELLGELLNSR